MRKTKQALIANNPLSKNIAKELGYEEGQTEDAIRKSASEISKIVKNKFGESLNFETITNWVLAHEEDSEKPRKPPSFDKLLLFSFAVNKKYWELFVPDYFINLQKLSRKKKLIIEMIVNLDNRYDDKVANDIQNVIAIHVDTEAKRLSKLQSFLSALDEKSKDDTQ
jgi:hypothetical protein